MAGTTITPTRMMLKQLKGRLKTARRGHKLMKDKRDELMRQFMDVVRKNKELRKKVEDGRIREMTSFSSAVAGMKESTSRCRLKGFFLFIIMVQMPPYS